MLRSLIVKSARLTPRFVKDWVHSSRFLDRVSRKTFERAMAAEGGVVRIESGPMEGLLLSVSEHISHAHVSGLYEAETQQAVARLVAPGSVCYDLGASIGYLSLLMARRAGRVYAFEPAPHAQAEIRKHAAANGFDNIEIVPSPVSDRERQVTFSLTDNAYGSCIVEGETRWPTLELTTVTLDDFAETHPQPDFVKMDVEGEEGRVLRGARSILRERRAAFCIELHSNEAAREVQDVLAEYDYEITTLEGGPYRLEGEVVAGEVQVVAQPR
jgi:FkbM family methyltransferase